MRKVKTCKYMEIVAVGMSGFEVTPKEYQVKMVSRTARKVSKVCKQLEARIAELMENTESQKQTFDALMKKHLALKAEIADLKNAQERGGRGTPLTSVIVHPYENIAHHLFEVFVYPLKREEK